LFKAAIIQDSYPGEHIMTRVRLRPVLLSVCAAVLCFVAGPRAGALEKTSPFEHFVARAPSESDPAATPSRVEIVIERWSTDKEREDLVGTLIQRGADTLLPTLQKLRRRAGVVLYPGIQATGSRARGRRARNLLFAREIATPHGRQVVIATDRYLGFGEPSKTWLTDYEFTLIDIRFGPDGQGVGKIAPASKVAYNTQTRILEVANFGARPVRLAEVRSARP
jgi:hypothetical protein